MNTETFDPSAYVRENSRPLSLTHKGPIGLRLRCIDDRASDSDDCDRPIAIPGGGLGLVMDVLGACTLLRRAGKHVSIEPKEAIALVERAIGSINFHTDEKSVQNHGVVCGGCGHCNGALVDPVKYLLSESDARFFMESGLAELKEKLKASGIKPTVYTGAHAAAGVMVVMGEDVDLPSVGVSGEHVYVYHQDLHQMILKLIAHELHRSLAHHSQRLSEQELETALVQSAQQRLAVTLEKLAKDLPQFLVHRKPELVVTTLSR